MVSFSCDGCQDTVKKPKLDQHSYKCGSSFTCIDCSKTFHTPDQWKGHTSCISEEQKYQKSLYKPKNNKNNKKADDKPNLTAVQPTNGATSITIPNESNGVKSNGVTENGTTSNGEGSKKRKAEEGEGEGKKEKKKKKKEKEEKEKKKEDATVVNGSGEQKSEEDVTMEDVNEKPKDSEKENNNKESEKEKKKKEKKEKKEKKSKQNEELVSTFMKILEGKQLTMKDILENKEWKVGEERKRAFLGSEMKYEKDSKGRIRVVFP